jgi:hypothetical protein
MALCWVRDATMYMPATESRCRCPLGTWIGAVGLTGHQPDVSRPRSLPPPALPDRWSRLGMAGRTRRLKINPKACTLLASRVTTIVVSSEYLFAHTLVSLIPAGSVAPSYRRRTYSIQVSRGKQGADRRCRQSDGEVAEQTVAQKAAQGKDLATWLPCPRSTA